ncbi:MAG: helix-turn-helix domain-containing protein [Filifactoraceae bacterium]
MIIADKILYLRKKNNLSQEELAEKLGVSRQSISKWEGALSIPDISKIMAMAQFFGVSTDYLLKDEVEKLEYAGDETVGGKLVSLEDAKKFISAYRKDAFEEAIAVSCFVLSIVPLIIVKALSEEKFIDENIGNAIGIILLLVLNVLGIGILIMKRSLYSFRYIKDGDFDLGFGVKGVINEEVDRVILKGKKFKALAMAFLIFSILPLTVSQFFNASDLLTSELVVLLLVMISIGIIILTIGKGEKEAYEVLLGEKEIRKNSNNWAVGTVYWSIVTVIYLGWSFMTYDWGRTWIVWVIGALLAKPVNIIFGGAEG